MLEKIWPIHSILKELFLFLNLLWQPDDNRLAPEVRLGKVRKGNNTKSVPTEQAIKIKEEIGTLVSKFKVK